MERVHHEALRRQFRTVQIASRNAGATDIDLTGYAQRHRLPIRVQNVDLRVCDRPADMGLEACLPIHAHPARIRSGFRRTVQVVQPPRLCLRKQPLHQFALQGFAGHVHDFDGGVQTARLEQGAQRRRHRIDQSDVMRSIAQGQHIDHDVDASARGQRREAFEHREIEVQRSREQGPGQTCRREGTCSPGQEIHCIPVLDHHTLGAAGGARGVDHVGQVVWLQCLDLRIVLGFLQRSIQVQHWHRQCPQLLACVRLRQHGHRGAVLQHVGQTILRI
ncbi:hypothetical protein GO281_04846 [Ralstonia solanacearum]|nr:hypothetical protein [Ralstonia solanacearum]NKF92861.1 hypothetical protein [Ralstonia solanacearum]